MTRILLKAVGPFIRMRLHNSGDSSTFLCSHQDALFLAPWPSPLTVNRANFGFTWSRKYMIVPRTLVEATPGAADPELFRKFFFSSSGIRGYFMSSIQHKLDRVRRPRVQITYDVETNGAMQKIGTAVRGRSAGRSLGPSLQAAAADEGTKGHLDRPGQLQRCAGQANAPPGPQGAITR